MFSKGKKSLYAGFCLTAVLALAGFFSACTTPSPLYGKWADNRGDTLTFVNDGTFVASIADFVQGKLNYDGDYTVLLNSLVLTCSTGKQIVTEWDIRGNILYMNWTDEDGNLIPLSLYKIAN
ncbi:hypothetical protein K7I13_03155 [Brucepastera parasyntrophica]|uniref:hypothetical protein n=1 Tax=Brucepastera parasyntrophica TaxID=2880008 RepID=UPI0021093CA4|nr:hypothetical protein [Brucepastera parasyntrophica]ULQ60320.1 hypothetical protein K7I13_03155 [Brucepastera parasyntrophica]